MQLVGHSPPPTVPASFDLRKSGLWSSAATVQDEESHGTTVNREESVPAEVLDAMECDLTRNDERVTVGTVPDLGSDTESLNDTVDGRSDVDVSVEATPVEPFAVEEVDERVPDVRISPAIREALVALDRIHLPDVFRRRATVMRVPRKMFRGAYCAALRLAMNEVRVGRREFNVLKQERGWKLFLLIPRLLLHRPARGGLIPRRKLRERFEKFAQGRWVELQVAFVAEDAAQTRRSRVSRTRSDSVTEQHGQSLLPILESCLPHGQLWKEPLVLQVTTSLFEHCRPPTTESQGSHPSRSDGSQT